MLFATCTLSDLFIAICSGGGPIPVAARSKALVCGRLVAGVAALNPTRGVDVCLVYTLCCPVSVEVTATG
jgi:hypothetical protein